MLRGGRKAMIVYPVIAFLVNFMASKVKKSRSVMKILVTGGAGFIGSHLVDRFIKAGHEVVVVDDLSMGKEKNINKKAKFYRLDIRDNSRLEKVIACERPEIVDHHAAQVSVTKSVEEPLWDAEINILGSLNLLELARVYKVRKVIYASTGGAVYGDPEYLPADEDHKIGPQSPYGISKFMVEKYLMVYLHNYSLEYTILRYPNVYGPRQDPHGEAGVVAIFSQQMLANIQPTIFGDGSKTRDYVYVGDIVEANILALTQGNGEIYNLGWGKEVSDYTIFDEIKKALNYPGEPTYTSKRPGEIENIALDATKVKRALGWKPKMSLTKGIKKATAYYKAKHPTMTALGK
jgi:UDP-glucose 4-epimerase